MRFKFLSFILAAVVFSLYFRPVEAQGVSFLKTNGKNLTFNGSNVILRGVNFDNIAALGAGIGTNNIDDIYFFENDYSQLASFGANHVRLGMSYSWYQKDRTHFFQKIDQQVAWARTHGIFISLLTFTNPDGTTSGCYEGYGNTCNIWTNSTYKQQLQNFWVDVATHYKDEPAIAGYDIINEPTPPGPGWCTTWFNLAQQMRNAITAVDPNHLIFISACSDPVFDRVFKEQDGVTKATNVIYEVHDYDPLRMSSPGYNSQATALTYPGNAQVWVDGEQISLYFDKTTFDGTRYPGVYSTAKIYSVNWANTNNVPIYIGEWGAQSFLHGYAQYLNDKGAVYNSLNVNHAFYTWKHDVNGGWRWGMYSRDGTQVDQPKVDAVMPTFVNSYRPTFNGTVTADGNGDGHVDGLDYVIWLNHYNQNVSGPQNGDFNNDSSVNLEDYNLWLSNY